MRRKIIFAVIFTTFALGASACSSDGDVSDGEVGQQASVTTIDEASTTSESAESSDSVVVDDSAVSADPDVTEAPPVTGDDPEPEATTAPAAGNGETTTSAPGTTAPQPTIQEEDEALACATVEMGYFDLLSGGDGGDNLKAGAQMAQEIGQSVYGELGAGLAAVIGTSDANAAADALLAQCEDDGFERLA